MYLAHRYKLIASLICPSRARPNHHITIQLPRDGSINTKFIAKMSVAQKPKQRISFTDAERQMLRRYHKDQPSLTPQQLASWFQGELGRKVSNSSIYDILSEKYAYLDDTEASDTSRRNRGPQWMELEDALFQWWRRVQPRDVTGKELKSRANEIWRTLPACHGKKVPSFSDGLLTNWRERHGLGQAARYADAELAKRGAERPQQVGCVSMITVPKSGE